MVPSGEVMVELRSSERRRSLCFAFRATGCGRHGAGYDQPSLVTFCNLCNLRMIIFAGNAGTNKLIFRRW